MTQYRYTVFTVKKADSQYNIPFTLIFTTYYYQFDLTSCYQRCGLLEYITKSAI